MFREHCDICALVLLWGSSMGEAAAGASVLESTVFTTEGLRPQDRFEKWRSIFNGVNEIEAPQASRLSFDGRSEHWRIGPFLLGLTANPERRLVRDRNQIRYDDIDHWAIRLSHTSELAFQIRDRSFICTPGMAAITSLADGYVEDSSGGRWIGLIFARDAYPDLTLRLDALGPDALLHTTTGALLGDFLLSLSLRVRSATADEVPAFAEMIHAMLLGCLPLRRGGPAPGNDVTMRARIEREIHRNIGSARLDVARLCALTGISRSALYRMFEDTGGIAGHIRRLRLQLVANDLANPAFAHVPIATLAEKRGFYCPASFSRSFREAYGRSPSEAREAAKLGQRPMRGDRPPRTGPVPGSPLKPSLLHMLR
jgi:AraC-like DNA-binding protein